MQWLSSPNDLATQFSLRELMWIVALGAILEGFIEPWWRERLHEHTAEHGPCTSPRVKTLRFFLNLVIWTPFCCELYYLWEHLLIHEALKVYAERPMQAGKDLLAQFGLEMAPDPDGGYRLQRHKAKLGEDIGATGVWDVIATTVIELLPGPLKPAAKGVSNAGMWTVLGNLEP